MPKYWVLVYVLKEEIGAETLKEALRKAEKIKDDAGYAPVKVGIAKAWKEDW